MGVDETEDAERAERGSKQGEKEEEQRVRKDSQGDENYEWLIIEAHRANHLGAASCALPCTLTKNQSS